MAQGNKLSRICKRKDETIKLAAPSSFRGGPTAVGRLEFGRLLNGQNAAAPQIAEER